MRNRAISHCVLSLTDVNKLTIQLRFLLSERELHFEIQYFFESWTIFQTVLGYKMTSVKAHLHDVTAF